MSFNIQPSLTEIDSSPEEMCKADPELESFFESMKVLKAAMADDARVSSERTTIGMTDGRWDAMLLAKIPYKVYRYLHKRFGPEWLESVEFTSWLNRNGHLKLGEYIPRGRGSLSTPLSGDVITPRSGTGSPGPSKPLVELS